MTYASDTDLIAELVAACQPIPCTDDGSESE